MAKGKLYLGDPEFTKKMMKLYAWIMPVVFGGMAILLLSQKCWIPFMLFLINFILVFPPLKKQLDKIKIKGLIKIIICIGLTYFGLYLTSLYL